MTDTSGLEEAHERAVDLASKLDLRTATTADERELAKAMIDVRRHIRTRSGGPDWTGTTGEARSRATEIYSAIDAPKDDLARLKNRMRQRFREIVPDLMHREDVAALIGHAEDLMDSDNFFNDMGIAIRHQGRTATTSVEATQLVLGASALLELIDPDVIQSEGDPAPAIVEVNLRAVADKIAALRAKLRA